MIADDCGINRNTFYYHSPNISALLQWTFSREALAISEKMDFLTDLQNAVDFTMNYIDSNRELCSFAYHIFMFSLKAVVREGGERKL